MFAMLRGPGASLARAMVQFGLDRNADRYEEIRPPTLVHSQVMVSTGQLPKFADDAYFLERDDLWAIPTAEVPLTSLASGEILRRSRPAEKDDGPHFLLSPRGGRRGPRHPGPAAGP